MSSQVMPQKQEVQRLSISVAPARTVKVLRASPVISQRASHGAFAEATLSLSPELTEKHQLSVKDAILKYAKDEWLSSEKLDVALKDLEIVLPSRARQNLTKLIHAEHGGQLNAHEAIMFVEALRTQMLRHKAHRETLARHVFLGGSCSPTTWRRDIIMPMLESANISCFNPQVDRWTPELVHKEAVAKKLAKVLLFVVDDCTRALASLIEIMELMLMGRCLVLVIRTIPRGAVITGMPINNDERLELNSCRDYVRRMARQNGIRVFDDIAEGGRYLLTICNDPETADGPVQVMQSAALLKPFVYMGGARSSASDCRWRQSVAKTLSRARVAYHNPVESMNNADDSRALADSSVILYVIDGYSRGARPMLESVHMISARKKCFIVINDIPKNDNSAGVSTKAELKDYNRARAYLSDCMSRHGFFVYRDLDLAVHYIVNAVQNKEADIKAAAFDNILTSLDLAKRNIEDAFRRQTPEKRRRCTCIVS